MKWPSRDDWKLTAFFGATFVVGGILGELLKLVLR